MAAILAAFSGMAMPAPAAEKKKAPPADPRIGVLEQELRDVKAQLEDIRRDQKRNPANDNSAALADLKRATSTRVAGLSKRFDAMARADVANGRVSFVSADGRFSFALRTLIQYDMGYFGQGRNPFYADLNSGTNFRRAQVGFTGTAWRDWSYNLTLDFGGNGAEKSGYIYTGYVEYDGLKPFGFRIGAYSPPEGIEDATGSADLLFLERAASVDVARNIAGAPSREAVTIFAQGERYFAAISLTGKKWGDASLYDQQQALVGRLSWLAYSDPDAHWLLDANLTHVFKFADTNPGYYPVAFSLSNGPELAVDSFKTVNTGGMDASRMTEWGIETAANYQSFYAQGGYFRYSVDRRPITLSDPEFSGWYALATWAMTGEAHRYDPTTASFRSIKPLKPLGDGGFGAFELKARYSNIDLDYMPSAPGGISGGVQDVRTAGFNWYPVDGILFALEYDNIRIRHVQAPGTDISADAIGLRSQLAL